MSAPVRAAGWKAVAAAGLALALVAAGPWLVPSSARADMDACFNERSDRQIAACTDVIEGAGSDPGSISVAYSLRALAYSLRGEYDTAIADYDEAIRRNPDFPVALNNRAWAHFKRGTASTGLPDVERALTLDPTSPHAYDTRAHILQSLGKPQAALADYERAMRFGDHRIIKLYQCGLSNHGLYTGRQDGRWSPELGEAMKACVERGADCDPLPPDEECRPGTS